MISFGNMKKKTEIAQNGHLNVKTSPDKMQNLLILLRGDNCDVKKSVRCDVTKDCSCHPAKL